MYFLVNVILLKIQLKKKTGDKFRIQLAYQITAHAQLKHQCTTSGLPLAFNHRPHSIIVHGPDNISLCKLMLERTKAHNYDIVQLCTIISGSLLYSV